MGFLSFSWVLGCILGGDCCFGQLRGCKPEPPKNPSLQIQPGQQRVQVDHLAAALERVVSIQ
jgi:hypothetical protein